MSVDAPITVNEGNDETVLLTVTGADLAAVTALELYLKDDQCDSDVEATLILSSDDAAEILILTQTATQITAEAYLPASALQGSYPRWYHVDAVNAGSGRRTALHGLVTVNDL